VSFVDNESKARFFLCPRCKQFVSVNVNRCRYCLFVISEEAKNREIQIQEEIEKDRRININKNIFRIGKEYLIVAIGLLFLNCFTLLIAGKISLMIIYIPIAIIVGLKYVFSSSYRNYREKR
jgi:hypothetical protein